MRFTLLGRPGGAPSGLRLCKGRSRNACWILRTVVALTLKCTPPCCGSCHHEMLLRFRSFQFFQTLENRNICCHCANENARCSFLVALLGEEKFIVSKQKH